MPLMGLLVWVWFRKVSLIMTDLKKKKTSKTKKKKKDWKKKSSISKNHGTTKKGIIYM